MCRFFESSLQVVIASRVLSGQIYGPSLQVMLIVGVYGSYL